MRTQVVHFKNIVETVYGLSLDERLELKNLLEHNIADTRRNEMADNYKISQEEFKSDSLEFSANINDLKKML
ncbi:MAG: hypothetical protein GZ094_10425 [Mariniphaga sp.]|nr:hypothetical protein [Mariniphaga sp.]